MALVYDLILVLHFLGLAALIGGYLSVLRAPRVVIGMVHGALTQVVTGLLLVGLAEAALDAEVNHAKIGVKLVVALAAAALAFTHRRSTRVSPAVVHAIGLLGILNVAVAVLWG